MTDTIEAPDNPMTVEDLGPEIDQVARTTYRRYGTWIGRDDTAQSLWVWVLTPTRGGGRRRIERYLEQVNDPATRDEGLTRIRLALRAQAAKVGEKEKADQSGYDVADVYWYTPARIADLIPDALDPDYDGGACAGEGDGGGGGKSTRLPEQKSDRLAAVLDVRRVIDRWTRADRAELLLQGDRFRWAVGRVLDELGGEHPRRAVISNERAALIKAAQYGGE